MFDTKLLLYNRAEKVASKLNKPEMCNYKSAAVPTVHKFQNVSGTAPTSFGTVWQAYLNANVT